MGFVFLGLFEELFEGLFDELLDSFGIRLESFSGLSPVTGSISIPDRSDEKNMFRGIAEVAAGATGASENRFLLLFV